MKNIVILWSLFVVLSINSTAQNVGIGTTTPTAPLTVIANADNKGIIQKKVDVEIGFYTTDFAAYLQTYSNHPLYFSTSNKNAQMGLSTTGNLGIGPNAAKSPNARLHVDGNAIVSDSLGVGTADPVQNLHVEGTAFISTFLGIGVPVPTYRLDLSGRMRIRSGGTGGTSAGIWLNKNDNSGLLGFVGVDGNNDIGIYSNTSGWSFLIDDATGNAKVKGTVTANGVTLTSDERLKKDITPLGDAMPLLEKLNGYQYHWKDETYDASLQTGLLAQEVEKVMPELVKTDDKGMKSVNYMGLIPYLLEAMKMQQQQMDELKKMVADYFKK